MTGDSYLSQAARLIRVLRRFVNYTGRIEVYGAPGCQGATKGLNVVCKPLPRKPVVGYAAKLIAVLASSLDSVLMLNTDNVLFYNPERLFANKMYAETGALLWPDLWGAACLNNRWGKTKDNPTGQMMCGQTGWQDHAMWTVGDIEWRPERPYTQEHSDTQLAVDLTSFGVQLAVELGLWIAESDFGKNVLHGEKDAVRFGFLVAGVKFGFADGPNQLMVDKGGEFRRVLYQSTLDGKAIRCEGGPTSACIRSGAGQRGERTATPAARITNGFECQTTSCTLTPKPQAIPPIPRRHSCFVLIFITMISPWRWSRFTMPPSPSTLSTNEALLEWRSPAAHSSWPPPTRSTTAASSTISRSSGSTRPTCAITPAYTDTSSPEPTHLPTPPSPPCPAPYDSPHPC